MKKEAVTTKTIWTEREEGDMGRGVKTETAIEKRKAGGRETRP